MKWKTSTALPLINMIIRLFCDRGTISMYGKKGGGRSIQCLEGAAPRFPGENKERQAQILRFHPFKHLRLGDVAWMV